MTVAKPNDQREIGATISGTRAASIRFQNPISAETQNMITSDNRNARVLKRFRETLASTHGSVAYAESTQPLPNRDRRGGIPQPNRPHPEKRLNPLGHPHSARSGPLW